MSKFKVTKTMLIDPTPVAEMIELALGKYLVAYPEGYYISGQRQPAMKAGEYYYQMRMVYGKKTKCPIESIDEIEGDVFNQAGERILNGRLAKRLLREPSVPFRGIDIVTKVIDCCLHNLSAWGQPGTLDIESDVRDWLAPEWQHGLSDSQLTEMSEKIMEMMIDIRTNIVDFIGQDGWIMHFQKFWNSSTIIIEKTIDYRIHAWEEEHGEEFRKKQKR